MPIGATSHQCDMLVLYGCRSRWAAVGRHSYLFCRLFGTSVDLKGHIHGRIQIFSRTATQRASEFATVLLTLRQLTIFFNLVRDEYTRIYPASQVPTRFQYAICYHGPPCALFVPKTRCDNNGHELVAYAYPRQHEYRERFKGMFWTPAVFNL